MVLVYLLILLCDWKRTNEHFVFGKTKYILFKKLKFKNGGTTKTRTWDPVLIRDVL
jgi:hypothetical protein